MDARNCETVLALIRESRCIPFAQSRILSATTKANPSKDGDAKPPVYGTKSYDSGVAGKKKKSLLTVLSPTHGVLATPANVR
jgi:hypothetical protein